MSLFLAPIHQIMFNKIHYLNQVGQSLLEGDQDLERRVNGSFKALEEGPLEDLIDQSNIHGWLQERVQLVEDRLAFIASERVKKGQEDLVLDRLYKLGQAENFQGDPGQAYQKMDQSFLDGMPCDHINEVIDNTRDSITWVQEEDIHSIHYQYGVEGSLYYRMRTSWMEGLLSHSGLKLEVQGQRYRIYR